MNKRYENENKEWTKEQIEYLEESYGEIQIRSIANKIKKSEEAVIAYAQKNGFGGYLFNGNFLTTGQAAEIIGVDYKTISEWARTGILKSKFRKIHKRKVYLIDPKDFKKFLQDNPNKWSTLKSDLTIFTGNEEWLVKKIRKDREYKYKKTNSAWSVKEEAELIRLANEGYTNREIAEKLCRTKKAIDRKRMRLISQNRLEHNAKVQEDNMVRQFVFDNWGRLTIKELAEATNRTEEQISVMQWRYGLPSLYDITDDNLFTLRELGSMLGVSRTSIRRWTGELGLKKRELNKGNKKRYVVDIRDVPPFLEYNKEAMTSTTYTKCKEILADYFAGNKKLKEAI